MAVGIYSIRLTTKILVEWVIFADITLAICMSLAMHVVCDTHACNICGCQFMAPFLHGGHFHLFLLDLLLLQSSRRHCKVADCVIIDRALRNNVACVAGWVFQFAEPQHRDGLDDLWLLLSNFMFHNFELCCGSTWILYKSAF
jgi:hypothetical protein